MSILIERVFAGHTPKAFLALTLIDFAQSVSAEGIVYVNTFHTSI